jgi:predicted DNA-binding transcriptional regulator AlpA
LFEKNRRLYCVSRRDTKGERIMSVKLLAPIAAIVIALGGIVGIDVGMAESLLHSYGFIVNDITQHVGFLAGNGGEWHAAAIAAIANVRYLTTKEVAMRYGVDVRSVQRRAKEGLLPPPYYFGTRFPRWSASELDENDRRLAFLRHPHPGPAAAAAKRAAAKLAAAEAEATAEAPPKAKRRTRSKTPAKPAPRRRRAAPLAEHEAAIDR